jgi:hypothetical protein
MNSQSEIQNIKIQDSKQLTSEIQSYTQSTSYIKHKTIC